jgi:ribonuclease T2
MDARRIGQLLLIAVAIAAGAATCAQEHNSPWPSDYFNPKQRPNAAGKFDYYTMVMSWSPTHCVTAEVGRDEQQCTRGDGLRYGFVLHGLWPQYEKGFPEACPTGRKPFVPQPVINSMLDIMPSGGLVIHEYKLHGTCSGLEPADYYKLSRQLFTRVRIPERFQNPFETQFVAPRELVGEFMRANPWLRPDMVAVTCGGPGSRLRDIRICMTRDGQPRACGQNEKRGNLCRADQMHVPPVRSTQREGAPSKSLEPKRDRGLPRPHVIESPGRF